MSDYEARLLQERKDKLADIAMRGTMTAAIAEHLGKGWEHVQKPDGDNNPIYLRDYLQGPNGEDIGVHFNDYQNKDRYSFHASFPRSEKGNRHYGPYGKSFSITCANGKPADQLAREIERRLLKGYRPELAKAYASLLEDQAREAQQESGMDRLEAAIGLKGYRKSRQGYSTETAIHFYTASGPSGSFQSYDGKTYEVKLSSIPEEIALVLAKMLRPGVEAEKVKKQKQRETAELFGNMEEAAA